jgi:hypothetical protein
MSECELPSNPPVRDFEYALSDQSWQTCRQRWVERQRDVCISCPWKRVYGMIVPWLASQTDILAEDWNVLDDVRGAKEW